MRRYIELPFRFALILAGFLFIFNLPSLLGIGQESIVFHFNTFWDALKIDFELLMEANELKFLDIFSQIDFEESYRYTMTLLAVSLIIVFTLSLVISIIVLMVPRRFSNLLKRGINFFEAVPDLLMIFFIQYFVIILYKETGLKFLQLYGVFGNKPLFVPIVIISFLPLFLLIQFLVKILTEEQNQLYALYGTAKGLSRFRILLVHILRNVLPLLILQLRTIILAILSNIFLVEFLFNLPGFTQSFQLLIFREGDIVALLICLLMFSFPLLLIESIGWIISKKIRGKEVSSI